METQKLIETIPSDELWSSVCLATKECRECRGEGETRYPDDNESRQTCTSCKGTGRILVLPGMQERCGECVVFEGTCAPTKNPQRVCDTPQHKGHMKIGREYCGDCHSTGWIAKCNLGALWAALPQEWMVDATKDDSSRSTVVSVLIPLYAEADTYISQSADIEKALLRAVAKALVAQGAELGGKEKP